MPEPPTPCDRCAPSQRRHRPNRPIDTAARWASEVVSQRPKTIGYLASFKIRAALSMPSSRAAGLALDQTGRPLIVTLTEEPRFAQRTGISGRSDAVPSIERAISSQRQPQKVHVASATIFSLGSVFMSGLTPEIRRSRRSFRRFHKHSGPSILRSRGLLQSGRSAAGWRTPSPASPRPRLTAATKWRFSCAFSEGPVADLFRQTRFRSWARNDRAVGRLRRHIDLVAAHLDRQGKNGGEWRFFEGQKRHFSVTGAKAPKHKPLIELLLCQPTFLALEGEKNGGRHFRAMSLST